MGGGEESNVVPADDLRDEGEYDDVSESRAESRRCCCRLEVNGKREVTGLEAREDRVPNMGTTWAISQSDLQAGHLGLKSSH